MTIVTPTEGLLTRTNTTVSGNGDRRPLRGQEFAGVARLRAPRSRSPSTPRAFPVRYRALHKWLVATGARRIAPGHRQVPATSSIPPATVSFVLDTTPPNVDPVIARTTPGSFGQIRTNPSLAGQVTDHDRRSAAARGPCRRWSLRECRLRRARQLRLHSHLALMARPMRPHSIYYRSTDKAGNTFTDLTGPTFTLDTTPPAVSFDLDPSTDSAPVGDQQTTFTTVTLAGQTEPNPPVTLVETGATTTADAAGKFSFTGVSLPVVGANLFHVQATDAAGNVGTGTNTFTLIQPRPCVFNDLTGWTTTQQGGSTSGQGTVAVEGDHVVLREGDSFHVASNGRS